MAYQRELDTIREEKRIYITDPFSKSSFKQQFVLRLAQYADGPVKLDIKRLSYGKDKRGEFVNLGRLSKYELEDLLPHIQEMMQKM